MFGSRFLYNGSTNSEKVYSFGNSFDGLHFLLRNVLGMLAPWPRKWGSIGPAIVYALHLESIAIFSLYLHYINGWCRIVVAIDSPMRVDARSFMNVFGTNSMFYRQQSLWDVTSRFALPHHLGGVLVVIAIIIIIILTIVSVSFFKVAISVSVNRPSSRINCEIHKPFRIQDRSAVVHMIRPQCQRPFPLTFHRWRWC